MVVVEMQVEALLLETLLPQMVATVEAMVIQVALVAVVHLVALVLMQQTRVLQAVVVVVGQLLIIFYQ
jgi:hypothetical protein